MSIDVDVDIARSTNHGGRLVRSHLKGSNKKEQVATIKKNNIILNVDIYIFFF